MILRKAFICPTKYVQGENEIINLGYFVSTFGKSALLIAHPDDEARVSEKLTQTSKTFGVNFVKADFKGECSEEEVMRLKALAKESGCDCTIGLGGGKALDTAKCVAEGFKVIIVPTIASTDAPTSALAVMYHTNGAFDKYAFFIQSPSVVLVDTTVIANAPTRFLCAGMGDALATYFEARANARSYSAVNSGLPCGASGGKCPPAHGTQAALTLAKLCYDTLLEDGIKAKIACDLNQVTPALESIIEANILLSGLGFENGGLAAAHAIHDGLTIIEGTHKYMHGEKVAFGTLSQLMLENAPMTEIEEVLNFCLEIGLPVCLRDIGAESITKEQIMDVAKMACSPDETIHAEPFPVTPDMVAAAISAADALGYDYKYGSEDDDGCCCH